VHIQREWLEELIFRGAASRRFTQDSPVLPDVWLAFGELADLGLGERLDLLLTPHRDATAAALAFTLRRRLDEDPHSEHRDTQLAYSQANVVASLTLGELLRDALPLSQWWQVSVAGDDDDLVGQLADPTFRGRLLDALRRVSGESERGRTTRVPGETTGASEVLAESPASREGVALELVWMIRVVGTIILAADAKAPRADPTLEKSKARFFALSQDYEAIVRAVAGMLAGMGAPAPHAGAPLVHAVSRNRRVQPTVSRSTMAVKADAARHVFEMDFRNLGWAVIDAGVDARNPAFRKRDARTGVLMPEAFTKQTTKAGDGWTNNTRVVRSFDFTAIRKVLNPDVLAADRAKTAPQITGAFPLPASRALSDVPAHEAAGAQLATEQLEDLAQRVTDRLQRGRALDWNELEPLLEILHDAPTYKPPTSEHGTHVAGILAGDWRTSDDGFPEDQREHLIGMCPTLPIYDFRVLGPDGTGDEFTVMAALQFIRHLNATKDQMTIHGANLSLSLRHDVANYACGRTPVCDECERVVASGVVVVAAAGNDGYMRFTTPRGDAEGYRSISISDPGNAESVITVGSTHRYQPHTYGVSYFSSRGPTGDGRSKPDLVAPGEKITAPVSSDAVRTMDGTSMAAPHVSGAAAMLLARHRELVGEPARIKTILCTSATDLGRERYFQGSGMVDILRALQSI
jgi:hypothetical protein